MSPAVRLCYLSVDGQEITEKTKITQRLIQEPDGYHPLTNDATYHNTRKRPDQRIVLLDGVTPPLGSKMAHDDMLGLFIEEVTMEAGHERLSTSKMFWRNLAAVGQWLLKYGLMLLIFMFVMLLVVAQLYQGGLF